LNRSRRMWAIKTKKSQVGGTSSANRMAGKENKRRKDRGIFLTKSMVVGEEAVEEGSKPKGTRLY